MSNQTPPHRPHRSARDRAMVVLIVGAVLLLPPVAGIFLIDGTIAGLPIPVLYVFAVWILLIGVTAALSRSLRDHGEPVQTVEASESNT